MTVMELVLGIGWAITLIWWAVDRSLVKELIKGYEDRLLSCEKGKEWLQRLRCK